MNERQKQLLKFVVETHIKSAEPVGSAKLVKDYHLDWSPATIRAELLALEDGGYLMHPHTSAGRIPTEKGYKFYVQDLLNEKSLNEKNDQPAGHEETRLERVWNTPYNLEEKLRALAKVSTELTSSLAIVSYGVNRIFFSGMKNLVNQPEFDDAKNLSDISGALDELEEYMAAVFKKLHGDVDVLIGSDNPMGRMCGSVVARLEGPHSEPDHGMFMFLGPMRMDYSRALGLAEEIKNIFEDENYGRRY